MTNYPAAIDNDSTLLEAINNLSSTLDGLLANDANGNNGSITQIQVASTVNFPTAGYIIICDVTTGLNIEVISYTSKDATHFIGITRGADGTTAIAHATGSIVKNGNNAAYHNNLKDAIIAVETALGVNPKSYGQAYRKLTFDFPNVNIWYVIALSGGTNDLKNITQGDFNPGVGGSDTTLNKLTVANAGIYRITYNISFYATGGAAVFSARFRKNDTTEIVGSYSALSTAGANLSSQASRTVIATLAANDFIALEVGTDAAGGGTCKVFYYDSASSPNPTDFICASVTMEKIG